MGTGETAASAASRSRKSKSVFSLSFCQATKFAPKCPPSGRNGRPFADRLHTVPSMLPLSLPILVLNVTCHSHRDEAF